MTILTQYNSSSTIILSAPQAVEYRSHAFLTKWNIIGNKQKPRILDQLTKELYIDKLTKLHTLNYREVCTIIEGLRTRVVTHHEEYIPT